MGTYSNTPRGHTFAGLSNLFRGIAEMKRRHKEQEEEEKRRMQEAMAYKQFMERIESAYGADGREFAEMNPPQPGKWSDWTMQLDEHMSRKDARRKASFTTRGAGKEVHETLGKIPMIGQPAAEGMFPTQGQAGAGIPPVSDHPFMKSLAKGQTGAPYGESPDTMRSQLENYYTKEYLKKPEYLKPGDVENSVYDQIRYIRVSKIRNKYPGTDAQYEEELAMLIKERDEHEARMIELAKDKKAAVQVEKGFKSKKLYDIYGALDEAYIEAIRGDDPATIERINMINLTKDIDEKIPIDPRQRNYMGLLAIDKMTEYDIDYRKKIIAYKVIAAKPGEIFAKGIGGLIDFGDYTEEERTMLTTCTTDDSGNILRTLKEAKAKYNILVADLKKNYPDAYREWTQSKDYCPWVKGGVYKMIKLDALYNAIEFYYDSDYYTRDIKVGEPGLLN